jgi:hypothetical protein
MHGPIYEFFYGFFRDQGSIIAGFLALVAGLLLYWSGERQIAQRNAEAAEHDRRTRLDLLDLFESQATHIAMLAEAGRAQAQDRSSLDSNAEPFARKLAITWSEVAVPGVATLVPEEVRLAAMELRNSVYELRSHMALCAAGVRSLNWKELALVLQNVQERAAALQSALKIANQHARTKSH